ncbi:MAG TPA: MaoC family dehydratase N-terminal domain-containing protein [Candidatus Binataceae bacterium]|nr:MaoC family dehydratase N-terminal domain-containing protein [Candidatus Binataceae bacterium]
MAKQEFKSGDPFVVTAEKIASFCDAVGDDNPLYLDPVAAAAGPYGAIVAPPALVASFRYIDDVLDDLPFVTRGGLMAGLDIEILAPIRAGDSISVKSEFKESYEKTGRTGTMTFTVVRSTLLNQRDEIVANVDHRMMRRTA